jgi:hypothetical protein
MSADDELWERRLATLQAYETVTREALGTPFDLAAFFDLRDRRDQLLAEWPALSAEELAQNDPNDIRRQSVNRLLTEVLKLDDQLISTVRRVRDSLQPRLPRSRMSSGSPSLIVKTKA